MDTVRKQQVTEAFGRRLRRLRQARGWTIEQLAFAAELHPTYVGSIERGERNLALVNIVRLARALELDPAELVQGLGQEP